MTDWLENLKRYALSDDMDYRLTWEDAAIALEEIERLQAKLFRKDERIKAWKTCSDEYEKECERLRAVLERIEVETSDEYTKEIVREALRDE